MSNASIFTNFTQFNGNKILTEIVNEIAEGKYQSQIQQLRSLIACGKQTEADQCKKALPAFTASGTFEKGRKTDLLQQYSHYLTRILPLSPIKLLASE